MNTRKVYKLLSLLLSMTVIASCGQSTESMATSYTISTITSPVATQHVTSIPSITPSPAIISTITPTITSTPTFLIDFKCPELSSILPEGISQGVISYWGRHIDAGVLFDLENGYKNSLPNESPAKAIVSQDRNKIAYRTFDKYNNWLLVVHILDGEKRIELSWPPSESDLSYWLDNEHLIFTDYSSDPPYSHRALNPFTEEMILLTPDYPEISHHDINWERAGSTVYDQTLEYVVYGAWDEGKNEHTYVLWHIPSKTQQAALPGNSYGGFTADYRGYIPLDGVSYNPPVWSTDNSRVAVISSLPESADVDEIFAMNKNGDTQQLTEFASQFEQANIRTLSWSPDGKQIAFFITTEPVPLGTRRNEQLAILDIETRKVSVYCLEGDTIGTQAIGFFLDNDQQVPAPLWSPDGRQIIIENRYDATNSRLILFDIPNNAAYEVSQNMQPFGWMLSEP